MAQELERSGKYFGDQPCMARSQAFLLAKKFPEEMHAAGAKD